MGGMGGAGDNDIRHQVVAVGKLFEALFFSNNVHRILPLSVSGA